MQIVFYNLGEIDNSCFHYAIICAAYRGKWVLVRHKERETWEIPAGHREENEYIDVTASRELFEETGAINYKIQPVCDYSVTKGNTTTFGRLFHAKVDEVGSLPDSEICEVKLYKDIPDNLTYPEILPHLHGKVLEYLKNNIIELLEKDRTRNINMVNFIRSYPVNTLDTVGDSVLVRGRSDEDWVYISSESYDEFRHLIQGLDDNDKCFAILEDWMLSDIVRDREIKSRLTSIKLVYDNETALPPERFKSENLSISDAPYIYENSKYKDYLTIEYIKDRIKNGIALGIHEDGKLVAWAITHDDGAVGFLNVLEGYRQKGYGTDVTVAVIKKLLELGEVPFVHIEENNIKSMNLALKVGFKKDRRIHWIKLC